MTPIQKNIAQGALLAVLGALGFIVLRPFLVSVAWALIIAYVTWPAYRRLRTLLSNRASLSALLMTALLAVAFVMPALFLFPPLVREMSGFYRGLMAYLSSDRPALPDAIVRLPWLGAWLQQMLDEITRDPGGLRAQFLQWANRWVAEIALFAGAVGRNAAKFAFAILTLFFAYRDGERLLIQIRRALKPVLDERLDIYLKAIGDVTRSVVYGIVLTALAQSVLAGLGYWAAGVGAPLFLAVVTAVIALIPFGTPFVWVPVGIMLTIRGDTLAGVGLLLWGTLVISWVDNLIRPLVISSAVRVPFLLVLFGVLGGIAAFGFIGLFFGPVVVAILMAVWREWQTGHAEP